MSLHHPSSVSEPVSYSAKQIFEEFLPMILKQQKDMAVQIGAVFNIKVNGEGGGEWTINTTEQKVSVGAAEHPDLALTVASEDFAAILNGKLDATDAMENNKLDIAGRPQLLGSLAALLRPAD